MQAEWATHTLSSLPSHPALSQASRRNPLPACEAGSGGWKPHQTLVYQPLRGPDSLDQSETKHPPQSSDFLLGCPRCLQDLGISPTVQVHSLCCSAKPQAHP